MFSSRLAIDGNRRLVALSSCGLRRVACAKFSAITTAPTSSTVSTSVATKIPPKSGSSFFQRLSAFFVGAGLGCGSCFYFIHEELIESNSKFETYLDKLETRIKTLESKK